MAGGTRRLQWLALVVVSALHHAPLPASALQAWKRTAIFSDPFNFTANWSSRCRRGSAPGTPSSPGSGLPFPPVHGVAYSSPPPPSGKLTFPPVHGVAYASPPPPPMAVHGVSPPPPQTVHGVPYK
jgi:hypothetical protein